MLTFYLIGGIRIFLTTSESVNAPAFWPSIVTLWALHCGSGSYFSTLSARRTDWDQGIKDNKPDKPNLPCLLRHLQIPLPLPPSPLQCDEILIPVIEGHKIKIRKPLLSGIVKELQVRNVKMPTFV
jgi:hypothetical protein